MSDSSSNSDVDNDSIDKVRKEYEDKRKGITSDVLALNPDDFDNQNAIIEQSKSFPHL